MSIDIEHTSGIDVVSTTAQNIPQRYTLHLPPFRFSHTKHSSGIPSKGHVGFTNLHSPRNSRPSITNYTKTTGSPQETTKLKVMHYFASLFCATAVEPLSTACHPCAWGHARNSNCTCMKQLHTTCYIWVGIYLEDV